MRLLSSVCLWEFLPLSEGTVDGLFKGEGWRGWLIEMKDEGKYEFLARCLMVFVVFIPFFGFKKGTRGNAGRGETGEIVFPGTGRPVPAEVSIRKEIRYETK